MTEREYNEAFARLNKKLIGIASTFVGSIYNEDIVANAFVRLWEDRQNVAYGASYCWLFAKVKNDCLNKLKHEKRRNRIHSEIKYLCPESDENLVESKITKAELVAELYSEIENAPPARKKIVLLYYQGLKAPEISKILNLSVDTVRVNLFKFKERFGKSKKNQESKIMLTYKGVTRSISYWSDQINISINTIHSRIKSNWTAEEIILTPSKRPKKIKESLV